VNYERWQQVKDIFEAALELGPVERPDFLRQASAGDEEISREVASLLAAHDADATFMETPIGHLLGESQVLAAGQRFGQYEEISPLGEGGMGQVYLAVDTRLQRQVALKLLPSSFMHDAERVRRFGLEARAASALNHPNIVTIHEIGQTDSLHFIATEFVEGETLRERLSNTRLTLGEVLDVGIQVASALQAAHEAGIVHRDIKPENIMLRPDGIVKVLDFGVAKLARQDAAEVHSQKPIKSTVHTNPGMVMGTVGYMSPEQARGQEVDARADIWSLGVVLYEMVAGRGPFEGETPSHVIVSILESTPRPLSGYPEVPTQLVRIVTKMLSKAQSERYQTAGQLALDLKNLKEELTVESRLKQFRRFDTANNEAFPLLEGATRELPANTLHGVARHTASVEYFVGEIRRHKTLAFAALLVLLVGALGLTYSIMNRSQTAPVVGSTKSFAVLPLKAIDTTHRDDIFETGVADSLIHRLSLMNGFVVRHLNATSKYRDIQQDPIAAGKEQRVDYVVAANYQLVDGKIRISAQLLNVAKEQIEGSYRIERNSSDIFAMQDEIATELANKLLTHFATTSRHPPSKRGTNNEEAYRLYLQGMYLANSRNLQDGQKAIEALEQAVRLDQNYARAWAGLGYTHRTISLWTRGSSTHETYQKSMEAINKALALDANLSEAHSALCENKYLYEWDFAGAERACKHAIELDPGSPQAHEIYSRFLMGRGRHNEAIVEIKTAIDLEPTSRFFQRNYGRALFYARRYPEAATQFKRVVEMDRNFMGTYSWLTSTLALQGNEAEAFEWFMKLLSVRKINEETVQVFKTAFQTAGWRGVLVEWIKRFEQVGGNTFDGAVYNAQAGNKDEAFEYLEKVFELREIWITYITVDPRLDPLRDDPRFVELVRRVDAK